MLPFLRIPLCFPLMITVASCEPSLVQLWLKQDTNGNGVLEKAETQKQLRQNFNEIDSDGNNILSVAELTEAADFIETKKIISQMPIPKDIEIRKNVSYREGHPQWVADLYLPKKKAGETAPGIVFIHGGGWKSGDKESGVWPVLPAQYAGKGYVCLSINYRLIPNGGGFPNCLYDVKNAVRWLRANASEFGLNPERIGAYGNSAGAHLASLLGLVSSEADLEGDGTHLEQSSLVQAVCSSATPTNFLSWGEESKPIEGLPLFNTYPPEEQEKAAQSASPVTYASSSAPPLLLVHAQDDGIVPYEQSIALESALKQANAPEVSLITLKEGNHSAFIKHSPETLPKMEAFFKKHLQE